MLMVSNDKLVVVGNALDVMTEYILLTDKITKLIAESTGKSQDDVTDFLLSKTKQEIIGLQRRRKDPVT